MEDEILEINGKKYKRSTLIDFGRKHHHTATYARVLGVACSIIGLFGLFVYLYAWYFSYLSIIFLPFLYIILLCGRAFEILLFISCGVLLFFGALLIVLSLLHRSDEYYISIAKKYIYNDIKE